MTNPIPPGFGRGGIPVRHRHTGGGGSKGRRQTDASKSGHELPLFYGKPASGQARSRRRRRTARRAPFLLSSGARGPEARRRAFLRRIFVILTCVILLTSYFRSGREGGGEADLAASVEDFNDWKLLRADRKRRRNAKQDGATNKDRGEKDRKITEKLTFGTGEGWDLPFVHIVNTRFMQSQGQLKTLAWARLYLFKAFCLSTMIHQTSQDFIWIIKTDPNLDIEIRAALVEMLKPYPNYYLAGSEHNYLIGHEVGAWRGGVEGKDLLESPIYTGDVDLLKRAHAVQNERIVLETRLDADDGLVTGYLEYIQRTALEKFGDGRGSGSGGDVGGYDTKDGDSDAAEDVEKPKWMYWCSRQNAEWFADPTVDVGVTNAVQHTLLCVTPGITIGFPVGTPYEDVRQYEHTRIIKDIHKEGGCGLTNNTACVDLVTAFPMMAVRSRTPTSAGMMGIRMEEKDALDEDKRLLLWKLLQSKYFGIVAEDVREANRFIHQNIVEIARDNLKGQCTRGHSCKQTSKEQLQRLTELALVKNNGISIDEPKYVVLEDGAA